MQLYGFDDYWDAGWTPFTMEEVDCEVHKLARALVEGFPAVASASLSDQDWDTVERLLVLRARW